MERGTKHRMHFLILHIDRFFFTNNNQINFFQDKNIIFFKIVLSTYFKPCTKLFFFFFAKLEVFFSQVFLQIKENLVFFFRVNNSCSSYSGHELLFPIIVLPLT